MCEGWSAGTGSDSRIRLLTIKGTVNISKEQVCFAATEGIGNGQGKEPCSMLLRQH
jgi:hypothetical protein